MSDETEITPFQNETLEDLKFFSSKYSDWQERGVCQKLFNLLEKSGMPKANTLALINTSAKNSTSS